MSFRHHVLALFLTILPFASAMGAGVVQSGTVTPGHIASWTTNGVVQDAGTAASGSLTSVGITSPNLASLCINSGPISTAYSGLCLGVSPLAGSATLSLNAYAGATALPFDLTIGGTTVLSATSTGVGLLGIPTAPTAAAGTSTTQLATTAFVTTGIAADFASPPPIGNVTPNTGQFTVLTIGSETSNTLVITPGTGSPDYTPVLFAAAGSENGAGIDMTGPVKITGANFLTGSLEVSGEMSVGCGDSFTIVCASILNWDPETVALISAPESSATANILVATEGAGTITLKSDISTNQGATLAIFSPNGILAPDAVNYLQFSPSVTDNAPSISAAGSDTNISITLTPKGTGNELVGGPINPSNPAAPLSLGTVTSNGVIVGNTSASQISINGETVYLGNSDGSSTSVYALGSTAYLGSTSGSSTSAYVQAQTVNIGVAGSGATSTNVNGDNLFLGDTNGASNDATLSAHYIAITTSNGMTVGSPSAGSYEGAGTINTQGLFVNGAAVATGGPYLPLAGGTLTGGLTGTTAGFSGLVTASGSQVTLGGADYPNSDPNIGDTYSFDYLNQTIGSSFDKYNLTGVAGITREMNLTSSGGFIIPIYGIATISATSTGGYAQAISGTAEFTSTGLGNGAAIQGTIVNDNTSVSQGIGYYCANAGTGVGEACFDFFNYGVPVYNVEFFNTSGGSVGSNALFSDTNGTTKAPVTTSYGTQWSGNTTFSSAEYTSPGFLIGPTVTSYNSRVEVLGGAGTAGPTIGVAGSGNGALGAGTNGATPATNAPLNIQALGTGTVNFKSHLSATGTAPALTACGTSPTIDATASDTAGTITEGTTATGCTATFHAAYASAPHCVVSSPSGAALTSYSATTTALTLVNASPGEFTYVCMQ